MIASRLSLPTQCIGLEVEQSHPGTRNWLVSSCPPATKAKSVSQALDVREFRLWHPERPESTNRSAICAQHTDTRSGQPTVFVKMRPMYWSFYLRKNVAYIPTTAKTEAGYWLAVEPVDVAPVANAEALHRLLLKAIGRGNPVVKTPTRQNFPPPVMGRYCGMKSLSAFERTAALWGISVRDDSYVICPWRRSTQHRGAWEEDYERSTVLPLTTPFEHVVREAAEQAFNENRP